jgi:hypothetical protein
MSEAIALINQIDDADERVGALAAVISRVPDGLKDKALLALIDATGHAQRSVALSAVQAGVRPTFELGGQEVVLELLRAITDVCRWYP